MNLFTVLRDEELEQMKQEIPGAAPAIVTDNNDPEGMGRVRVRYPWMAGNPQSYWARVAVPFAGPGQGAWHPLQINDEVLVVFELGHVDVPYVVGRLWNGVDLPPETDPQKHAFVAGAWRAVLDLAAGIWRLIAGGKARVEGGGAYAELDADAGQILTGAAGGWADSSATVSLAGGGAPVARVGDQVEVEGTTSDGATFSVIGTIISGSSKVTAG